jgi:hypothetical protein
MSSFAADRVSPGFPASFTPAVERKAAERAARAAHAAHASGRRRLIDPATCERDYSAAEVEFMMSMQAYKLSSGRLFPTWSEALEVLRTLGYEKVDGTED